MKTLFKKMTCAALALTMAIGMIACGPAKEGESSQTPESKTVPSSETTQAPEPKTTAASESTQTTEAGAVTTAAAKQLAAAIIPAIAPGADAKQKVAFADILAGKGAAQYLIDPNGGNRVYSPFNASMALAMLAEITDGSTRKQILDVLGVATVEELRNAVATAIAAEHNDGDNKLLLANSLWLRSDYEGYNSETLKTLAENYLTASYSGQMGTEEYNKLLRQWLKDNTGGLLDDAAEGIELNEDVIIALASTLYYKTTWVNPLEDQGKKIFHGTNGDSEKEFMGAKIGSYYKGEHFIAASIPMADGNTFWALLPDDGFTTEDIVNGKEYLALIKGEYSGDEGGKMTKGAVNLSLPKFDVESSMDLIEGLKALGITDAFDSAKSDFSALYSDDQVKACVTEATHAARVKVDEYGVEAAAFTVVVAENVGEMGEPINIVCDRPFVFAISNTPGTVLFEGVVNQQ